MIVGNSTYAIVAGYVPKDAESRTTQTGKRVCNFSVKAKETKDESGNTSVVWLNCVAWSDHHDVARYLRKGDFVLCAGEFQERSYTTREGEERTVRELKCEFVMPMRPPVAAPMFPDIPQPSTSSASMLEEAEDLDDDDLPF